MPRSRPSARPAPGTARSRAPGPDATAGNAGGLVGGGTSETGWGGLNPSSAVMVTLPGPLDRYVRHGMVRTQPGKEQLAEFSPAYRRCRKMLTARDTSIAATVKWNVV